MNKKPIHSAISAVLRTLNSVRCWMELDTQTSEPMDQTLNILTVISDLRGAARYVLATEGDHTAAALLMMTAVYLKQLQESTGLPDEWGAGGFPALVFEMMADLEELIYAPTDEEYRAALEGLRTNDRLTHGKQVTRHA